MFSRQPNHPQDLGSTKVFHNRRDRASTLKPESSRKSNIFAPDSELGKLLTTNLSPSNVQRDEIRALKIDLAGEAKQFDQLASSKRKEIAKHEKAISLLRDEVVELEQQAEKVRKDEACALALLERPGPICILPTEILGEIFLACLYTWVFAHTSDAPLLLCRVCSAWRAIARSTPALWSHLTIDKQMNLDSLTRFATSWFVLAGDLPLSLGFFFPPGVFQPILRQNTPSSNSEAPQPWWKRISRLDVELESWRHALDVLEIIGGLSQNIRYSSIFLRSDPSWSTAPRLSALLPNLRSLTIGCKYTFPSPYRSSLPMPLGHLARLSMGEFPMTITAWQVTFRECVAIEHGVFLLQEGQLADEQTQFIPVSFQRLLSLKIVFRGNGDWTILKGFSFPSLRSLALGSLKGLSVWNEQALMNVRARSLEALTLFKVEIQPEELIDFLRTTPGLRSFLVDSPLYYDPLIKQLGILAIQNQNNNAQQEAPLDVFLPKLSRISFYHWRSVNKNTRLAVKALADMVRTRWSPENERATAPPGKCLTSISVRTLKPNYEVVILKDRLARLRKEGLALHVGIAPQGYCVKLKADW